MDSLCGLAHCQAVVEAGGVEPPSICVVCDRLRDLAAYVQRSYCVGADGVTRPPTPPLTLCGGKKPYPSRTVWLPGSHAHPAESFAQTRAGTRAGAVNASHSTSKPIIAISTSVSTVTLAFVFVTTGQMVTPESRKSPTKAQMSKPVAPLMSRLSDCHA